ncbi:MAG: phosphoribosylformylglycinamidine synthase subunit PurS [Candidatus Omnitrophica bacterium]|nr:phosphoribosylformylglycinamidine synthase subunit PurS [Candidatus Omnitrophota bacterium]
MDNHRIEVWYRKNVFDPGSRGLCGDILDLGIKGIAEVKTGSIFLIQGKISPSGLQKVARELLADPVTQDFYSGKRPLPRGAVSVEVWFKEGVTDTVGETAEKGITDLGIAGKFAVSTARRYLLYGKNISKKKAADIAGRLLANEVIQTYKI